MCLEQKKYELLRDDTIEFNGRTLYRIKATDTCSDVRVGELGGYIESEDNLSHSGDAWVFNNAKVFNDAIVHGNAMVGGEGLVYGKAQVYGDARVDGNAMVGGESLVYGKARVYGDARVDGNALVRGYADISGRKMLFCASNVGSETGTLTVFNGKDGLIVTRGCFTGTTEEFLERSKQVHDDKIHHEYKLLIEVAKSRILG